MKTLVIRHRVADFLKQNPPFDGLLDPDLLELAGSGRVKFHESGEYVFRQGDGKGQFVWMIQQGKVELVEENGSGERLRDVLGEGDLLGLERFAGDGTCLHSARTASDVILYGVAAAPFEAVAERYPSVRRFLAAHASVSGNVGFNWSSWLDAEAPPLEFLRARSAAVPAGLPAVPAGFTTRDAVREMIGSRSAQLAVAGEAILTAPDLALFCGRDPLALIGAIREAASAAVLAPLARLAAALTRDGLAQPHDIDDCCRIGAEAQKAMAEACVRLAEAGVRASGIEAAKVPHCRVLFGRAARGGLLAPEFPALAAVYGDGSAPEDDAWFAALAGETDARFDAIGISGAGFDWPDGAKPAMPVSEWKRLYSETIRNPLGHDLYACRALFDLRPLSGSTAIFYELAEHIRAELNDHETAIPLLANDTLAHVPPLTFFRGLVLDMEGGQHDSFDISEAVVSPIVNAARVFALAKRRLDPAGTLERLENAAADFPEGATIFRQSADAFRIGLYYQALAGTGGGSRIDPSKLGKFDRVLLKTAFSSIQRFLEFTVSIFVPVL
jgi:signal-transduction protein with cAMP-binding, CBS, and nucleotidyltransferase domain